MKDEKRSIDPAATEIVWTSNRPDARQDHRRPRSDEMLRAALSIPRDHEEGEGEPPCLIKVEVEQDEVVVYRNGCSREQLEAARDALTESNGCETDDE